MTSVLTGFGVVLVVMALGWVLARTGTLGPQGQRALAAFVYAIATPALLFDKLIHTDPAEVFSTHLAVAAISALAVGACFGLFARWAPPTPTPATSACRWPPTCSATPPRWCP